MDIFEQLKAIDNIDIDAIEDQSFFKDFSPFMAIKWYASVKDSKRIHLVNTIINPVLFSLHRDKKLLYYLFCCCSDGNEHRYSWIKRPKNKNVNVIRMVMDYYQISTKEAKITIKELSKNDLLEILECMDYDTKTRNKIKKQI